MFLGLRRSIIAQVILPDPLDALSFLLRLQTHNGDGVPVGLYTDTGCTTPATASGDAIAAWRDESKPDGLLITQSNASQRPTLHYVGGKPVVRFDGVDDCMSFDQPSGVVNVAGYIAMALNVSTLGSNFNAGIAWSSGIGGVRAVGFGSFDTAGSWGLYTTFGPEHIDAGPIAANTRYVLDATWLGRGATNSVGRDGSFTSGAFTSLFDTDFTTPAYVGIDAGSYFTGDVTALLVGTSTFSDADRLLVNRALAVL